jgi:hypothetical protein
MTNSNGENTKFAWSDAMDKKLLLVMLDVNEAKPHDWQKVAVAFGEGPNWNACR